MIKDVMIFDSHAHMNDKSFEEDRSQVIENLVSSGIGYFTEIGFDMPSSLKAVELAGRYANVYAAVGFHPDHSDRCQGDQ